MYGVTLAASHNTSSDGPLRVFLAPMHIVHDPERSMAN